MPVGAVVAALSASAALVLLASGLAKLARPQATTVLLAGLFRAVAPQLPRRPTVLRPVARLIGVGEAAVAAAVLALGGRGPLTLMALAYLVFAVVAARLLAGNASVSCGCFGREDTPVSRGHLVVTGVALVVASVGAMYSVPAGGGLFGDGLAYAVAGSVLVGLLAWLAYLTMTALPALSSARRLLEATS